MASSGGGRVRSRPWRCQPVQGARGQDASTGCPSSTSARCSAASQPPRPTAARRSSTSGAATRRSARPPTSSRRSRRPPGGPTATATRRSAGCPSSASRSPAATATTTASRSTPTREVAVVPGTKAALLELALALAQSGDRILLPDPHYPDYPSGIALAGAELRVRSARPGRRLAARPRERSARRGSLPELPVEPLRRLRRPRALRGGGRLCRAHRDGDRPRRGLQRPRLRRPQARELPRDARGEGRRSRALDDVQDLRDGGLAAGVRPRQRRDRRAGQPARRPLSRRDLRARSSTPRSRRSTARRTASRSAAPATSAAATGSRPRCPSRPCAKGRSTSGSACRTG